MGKVWELWCEWDSIFNLLSLYGCGVLRSQFVIRYCAHPAIEDKILNIKQTECVLFTQRTHHYEKDTSHQNTISKPTFTTAGLRKVTAVPFLHNCTRQENTVSYYYLKCKWVFAKIPDFVVLVVSTQKRFLLENGFASTRPANGPPKKIHLLLWSHHRSPVKKEKVLPVHDNWASALWTNVSASVYIISTTRFTTALGPYLSLPSHKRHPKVSNHTPTKKGRN